MRRFSFFIAVLLLASIFTSTQLAPVTTAQDSDAAAAQQLAQRARQSKTLMANVEELCDQIGGRPTGSPACQRAIDWGLRKFKTANVNATLESFTLPNLWLPVSADAVVLSPELFSIRLAAAPQSVSTPAGRPLTARLLDAGEGSPEEFAKLGSSARGAIALVHSPEMKTLDDLFAEYLKNSGLLEAAKKAHVAALLLQSSRPRGLLYRHPVALNGEMVPVPTAVISREHAARLGRLLQKGPVRMRLSIQNKTGGAYQSQNVVGEIRGREKPDEIVLLGAHLDSWDLGTGANDNGVNAALVIDVARAMKELGLVPRRTIRFVLFTGEEQGMWGSAGYVQRHRSELDRYKAIVIFDIGSGRTSGFFLNGREDLRAVVNDALSAVGDLHAGDHLVDGVDGTDNFDFLLSGVPNLVANQDAAPYLPDYHAESDVLDMVDAQEARNNEAIAAVLVWGLSQNTTSDFHRQTRAEVEELLKRTTLDQQMKAFGQWSDWTGGRRGVSR